MERNLKPTRATLVNWSYLSAMGLFALSLSACSLQKWVDFSKSELASSASTISGQVDPWSTSSSMRVLSSSTCTSAQAYLFKLDGNGTKIEPALEVKAVDNGKFQFNNVPSDLGLTNLSIAVPTLIQVAGCGKIYSRLVTKSTSQNLNDQTSLLTSALNSSLGPAIIGNMIKSSGQVYATLSDAVYNNANTATTLNQLSNSQLANFTSYAGYSASASVLADSYPDYVINTLPTELHENQNAVFDVLVSHWNSSYVPRVEWVRNGVTMSTNSTYVRMVGLNEQNSSQSFVLKIGKEAGGSFDLTSPVMTYSFERKVTDDFPAQVPPVILASATPTSSPTAYLQVTTGAGLANCATFSRIAVTEDDPAPPAPTAFTAQNISCTNINSQIIPYTLSPTSGTKTLRVWTIDSADNVSLIPAILSVTFDPSAPTLAFNTPAANAAFNGPLTVTGTCESSYNVLLGGAGASSSQTVPCSGGAFSAVVTLSSGDGSKQIDISQTDLAGNTNLVSRTFILDTIAPNLTLVSPATNTSAQSGVTISGACESGLSVVLSGSGLQSPSSTACLANNYSQAILFTSGDGTKNITVTQTDTAGNSTSVSTTFVRDTAPPVLSITSPSSGTSFQGSATITGTCEAGASSLTLSGGLTSPSTVSCSAGAFSAHVVFTTGDGTKVINFSQSDAAGNIGSVSISLINDNTPPSISFVSPLAGTSAQNGVTITGSCEGVLPITIGGPGLSSPTSTTCNFGSFSQAIVFTSGDGTKTITISQTDSAGNVGSASRDFVNDTTPPALAITGPAANTSAQTGVTLTGTCETGLALSLSGVGLSSPASATCSSGAFSQAVTFTAGDGVKNIIVSQVDLAGNSSSDNRDFIKDTTPPAIDIVGPPAGTAAQASVTLTGHCETGLTITYGGTGILSTITGACSGGTYSQQVFFSSGDGTKTITVSQTDSAGNTGTASMDYVRDTVSPAITQTAQTTPYYTNTNTATFGGACETGLTISVTLSSTVENTIACSSGAWTYTPTAQTTDATRIYTFSQTDAAGNTGSVNASWVRDTVAPVLTFTSSSNFKTSSNSVTFAGACESGFTVVVGGSSSASVNCVAGAWSYSPSNMTDGTYSYSFSQTDFAGNATTINGTWVRNTTGPVITITSQTPVISTGNSDVITGTCTSGLTIAVSNAVTDSVTCNSGTFSYTASASTDGSRQYDFSQTDIYSNTSTASAVWTRDTTAPAITAGSFEIGNGSGTIGAPFSKASFSVTDNLTRVMKFCLKVDDAVNPASSDGCWVSVASNPPGITPAISISVSNYPFLLSFDPGAHTLYLWAMDEAGNMTSQSSTSGTDMKGVTYTPAIPPHVDSVIATSSETPSNPPSSTDTTVGAGSNIYIKWKSSNGSIALQFSVDDTNWTPIVSGISNSSGAGCQADDPGSSLDDGMTGCYVWSSPTGGTLRVRVLTTDSDGNQASRTSNSMNTGVVKILAGNISDGLGGSATTAMFFNRYIDISQPDIDSFIILDDGTFIFRDMIRGLLKVDATTGLLTSLIPTTGSSTGDGGSISAATLNNPYKIALDYQNRVLIWDNDRIRRIDFSTNTISTLIGGGSQTSDNVVSATQVNINPAAGLTNQWEGEQYRSRYSPLVVLPNGDIYFQSENWQWDYLGQRFRVYHPGAGNEIQSIYPSGVGTSFGNTLNINLGTIYDLRLSFDPVTSAVENLYVTIANVWGRNSFRKTGVIGDEYEMSILDPITYAPVSTNPADHVPALTSGQCCETWAYRITGMDGKLYALTGNYGTLQKYNSTTKTWSTIIGSGIGSCADGTVATSCPNKITAAFIDKKGKVYFMDDGQLRTVTSAGKVATIYGQSFSYGDGGSPLQARFGALSEIQAANDGTLLMLDKREVSARETNAARSIINHLTGNGTFGYPAVGVDVGNQPIHTDWDRIGMTYDQSTKTIYYTRWNGSSREVIKLNRATNQWQTFVGAGATSYISADGLSGNQVAFDALRVVGFGGGKVLVQNLSNWYDPGYDSGRTYSDSAFTLYDSSTTVQSTLLKYAGAINFWTGGFYNGLNLCADGTSLSACISGIIWWGGGSPVVYDSAGARWLYLNIWNSSIRIIDPAVGTMQTLANLPHQPYGLAYRVSNGHTSVYYCGNDSNLYKYDVTVATETRMALPTTMKCPPIGLLPYSNPVVYDPSTDKILFIWYQGGLYGVAQIDP